MFEIKLAKGAKPGGGTLLSAFPSVGMVSTIAGSYIAEALDMKRLAYVISDEVPPAALVQDGVPTYPLRIVGQKNLAVLSSEFQLPLALAGQMARAAMEWSVANGFDMVIGLEGLMTDQPPGADTESKLYGVGSTDSARKMVVNAGIEQFKAGMITGVSGAMLAEGELLGRDVIVLLVSANPLYPDARGAARLVEGVMKLLPKLELDLKELYEEAARIEENVKATVEKTKELLAARQSQAERLGRSYMYG